MKQWTWATIGISSAVGLAAVLANADSPLSPARGTAGAAPGGAVQFVNESMPANDPTNATRELIAGVVAASAIKAPSGNQRVTASFAMNGGTATTDSIRVRFDGLSAACDSRMSHAAGPSLRDESVAIAKRLNAYIESEGRICL